MSIIVIRVLGVLGGDEKFAEKILLLKLIIRFQQVLQVGIGEWYGNYSKKLAGELFDKGT